MNHSKQYRRSSEVFATITAKIFFFNEQTKLSLIYVNFNTSKFMATFQFMATLEFNPAKMATQEPYLPINLPPLHICNLH